MTAPSVASQVAALKKDNPDTWMIFATPGPTIRAYITATKLGFKPSTIITNSVSATDLYLTIAKKGGSDLTDGTITDAYAKDPASPLWKKDPGMRTYYRLMGRFAPKANLIDGNNLYGFAKAYTFVDTLYKAGKNPTRESLMAAAQTLNEKNPFLLPGVVVKTSKTDHFAVSQITLTKYTNNTFVNFGGLFNGRH